MPTPPASIRMPGNALTLNRSGLCRSTSAADECLCQRPRGLPESIGVMPIALMLATLTDRRDFGEDWLLERKFDGERCVACKSGREVRLESRTAKDLTGTYPEVRDAVAAQRNRELLLDGEVVAFDSKQTSFSRLQRRLGVTNPSRELITA